MDKSLRELFNSLIFGTIVGVIIMGCLTLQTQQYAQFFEQDPSVSYYRHVGDIVPMDMLLGITFPISICSVLLFYVVPTNAPEDANVVSKLIKMVIYGFGLLTSGVTNQIATQAIKSSVGRPRPMALYGCNYMGYRTAVDSGNFTSYLALTQFGRVGDVAHCYDSESTADMWSSFPSGHASFSCCTLVFACLMLRRLLAIERHSYHSWQNLVAFGPVAIAAWVSVTRVVDMKHHVDDVLAGFAIGTVCAVLAFRTAERVMRGVMQWRAAATGKGRGGGDDDTNRLSEGLRMSTTV